jgi:hypothetical protein
MLCRACEESVGKGEEQSNEAPEPRRPRSRRRASDAQLCSRCGDLLGQEEMELRALRKKSQLAKFGLAGKRRPLLKRRDHSG